MSNVTGVVVLALLIILSASVDYVYRRQRCPLTRSMRHLPNTCLRRDGDSVMVYTLRQPDLSWWRRLYLPLNSDIERYWDVRAADAAACELFEYEEARIDRLMRSGAI